MCTKCLTKTAQATLYFLDTEFAKGFQLVKTFKLGLTPDERRAIIITAEVITGKGQMYRQLGLDLNSIHRNACDVVNRMWLQDTDKTLVVSESIFSLQNKVTAK